MSETQARAAAQQSVEVPSLYDKMHLWMISIVHDTLYRLFFDPYRLLAAAGLGKGQAALEVGCGPGFFTIPAAEIVGTQGHLHSIDINPAAVERVRQGVEEKGLTNVEVFYADATGTGMAYESVDVAFLFGILRSLKDLDAGLAGDASGPEWARCVGSGKVILVRITLARPLHQGRSVPFRRERRKSL